MRFSGMSFFNETLPFCAALALALGACTGTGNDAGGSAAPAGDPADATRPAGEPQTMTVEGRLADGVACSVINTPDGRSFAINPGDADFGTGDYVRVHGELADASFCMQGEGTIVPSRIEAADPPARDRDPARAGGIALTADYVIGGWVAKGPQADCAKPDFDVTLNSNGMAIIETRINGYPETGAVDVGPTPALQWDEPLPALPIDTRGPDGLAVMPSPEGEIVTLAGHRIEGDGVVFVRCG